MPDSPTGHEPTEGSPPHDLSATFVPDSLPRTVPDATLVPGSPVGMAPPPGPDTSGTLLQSGPPAPPPRRTAVPTGAGRFVLRDEIARGGMGVVYRAADVQFDRDVAVKLVQTTSPTHVRRFFDEARITGQLQHPGIPPVYEVGILPDGRPFLAMKLIQGETLDTLLTSRPNPSADRGRLLGVFEAICQAVGYAHSRGVIHRDLKPANVMVGSFGEVQIMDWGLAKLLASRERERPEARSAAITDDPNATGGWTDESTPGDGTRAGSVLGTPAYMPPEQATGAVNRVDARSDVFGLGGILCTILTGRPPYVGDSGMSTLKLAATADLAAAFARLAASGAEPDLVALCRRCLSPDPADRPADAGAVAAAVAGLRQAAEERARRAELDRAAADLRAAEQRRRVRLRLALAVAVALLLATAGGFAWYSDRREAADRDRRGRNLEAVESLLDQTAAALAAGDSTRTGVSLEAARRRAGEGGAEGQADRLDRLAIDREILNELDRIDLLRWAPLDAEEPEGVDYNDWVRDRHRQWYAAGLGRFGLDPDAAGPGEAAARVTAAAVRDRLVAALDRVLRLDRSPRVRVALRTADPDPFRDAVRDAVAAGDAPRVAELAARPEADAQQPEFVAVLGENRDVPTDRRRALLTAAARRRPGNAGLLMALGRTYPEKKREFADARARWFQAAAEVSDGPVGLVARVNLGMALRDRGDLDEAVACLEDAVRRDRTFAPGHLALGRVRRTMRDYDGAIAAYREALRINPRYLPAYNNLGNALSAKGDLTGSIAAYRQAIAIDPGYATAHNNLGMSLRAAKDLDGAIAAFREAIRLRPAYVQAHTHLGNALRAKKDYAGAAASYREALRLDPTDSSANNNLGNVLRDTGDRDGAVACFREAVRLNPDNAIAHNNLSTMLLARKDYAGAAVSFRELARLNPADAGSRFNLGNALHLGGDPAGAEAAYRDAVRLSPDDAGGNLNLGLLLRDLGRFAEALPFLKRGHELGSKRPGWRYPSARWVADCERELAAQQARTAPPPRAVGR